MKHIISLDRLSKYRSLFMGMAIVFVMLCHNTVCVPEGMQVLRDTLSSMFQSGVDIFMLLSGLGLYYSFRKKPNVGEFLKKRFTKLLIPYVIVVFGYAFIYVGYLHRATLIDYLWEASLISFFTNAALRVWFIAAILLLYLLFPLLYAILQKTPKGFAYMIIGIFAGCLLCSYLPLSKVLRIINEIFVSRIPAFLTGMMIAKSIRDEKAPSVRIWPLCLGWGLSTILIVWIICIALNNWWTIARLLFLPFALSGMLLLSHLLDHREKTGRIQKTLIFLGGITFEIYLLHDKILSTINEFLYLFEASPIMLSVIANSLAIILSVFGAWLLQRISSVPAKGIAPKKQTV